MQAPNDEIRPEPECPETPEPIGDGAESVWDPALIRLYLQALAGKQRRLLH